MVRCTNVLCSKVEYSNVLLKKCTGLYGMFHKSTVLYSKVLLTKIPSSNELFSKVRYSTVK